MIHESDPSNRPCQTQLNEGGTYSPVRPSAVLVRFRINILASLGRQTQFQIIIACFDPALMEKGTEIHWDGSVRTIEHGSRNTKDIELRAYTGKGKE